MRQRELTPVPEGWNESSFREWWDPAELAGVPFAPRVTRHARSSLGGRRRSGPRRTRASSRAGPSDQAGPGDPDPEPPDVARLTLTLARLACDVDQAVSALEDAYLSDGEAAYIDPVLLYLTRGVARLGQLVYEAEKLDDRPRRERLGMAA